MARTIGVVMALKDKCSPNLKAVADKLGITEKAAKRLNSQIGSVSQRLKGQFKGAVETAKKTTLVLGGALGALGLQGLKTAADFEQYNISFATMLGSHERAKKLMDEITKFASATPYAMPDLVVGTQRLLAFGINADVVVDRMGRLGDLAKGDSAILDRLTLAFGKIRAKGKASLEELNMLTEAGVPIMDTLAKQQGLTTKKLFDYVSKGKIGYKEVEQAVISLTSKGGQYYQMTLKQSKSLTGVVSTLKDSFNIMLGGIMQDYLPQIKGVVSQLIDMMPQIKATIEPIFRAVGNVIQFCLKHFNGLVAVSSGVVAAFTAFNVIKGVIVTIQTLQAAVKAVTAAQGIWNAVTWASPIGLIALGIGALVGVIVLLIQNWDKVTAATKKAFEMMKKTLALTPLGLSLKAAKHSYDKITGNKETPRKHATGTAFSSGGEAVVGEFGPEQITLPKGSSVTPANKTRKMLNGGQNISISVVVQGNMIGNNEFINRLSDVFASKLRTAMAIA